MILPIRKNGTEGRWQVSQSELQLRLEQGRVRLGRETSYGYVVNYIPNGEWNKVENGDYVIVGKNSDGSVIAESNHSKRISVAPSQWKIASHNASENGTSLLSVLLPGRPFPFPKSLYAVEDALRFFIADKPEAVVLDFFAGSGTTAHAVMRLNHEDGGKRRCICITNNELSDSEEKKLISEGYRKGDSNWEERGICEYITKPRIKASITGIDSNGIRIDSNKRYGGLVKQFVKVKDCRVVDSNGKAVRKTLFAQEDIPDPSINDQFSIAEGLNENAIFFDLTYQDPNLVELGADFEEVAPLLWLRAGSQGRIIEHESTDTGYVSSDAYAILFDYSYANEFTELAERSSKLQTLFVVTDDEERYRNICEAFPERDVVRLYESYLRSFKIASEGALA